MFLLIGGWRRYMRSRLSRCFLLADADENGWIYFYSREVSRRMRLIVRYPCVVYIHKLCLFCVLHTGLRRSSSDQQSIIFFVAGSANTLSARLATLLSLVLSTIIELPTTNLCNTPGSPSVPFDDDVVCLMFLFGADDAKSAKKIC